MPKNARPAGVVVTGVDIPFFSLVSLLVKLAIASVPAAIIVAIAYFLGAAMVLRFAGGH